MFISEIFYSIQGEGILSGIPSVFIRTSGCDLRCRWCDTRYASWEPVGKQLEVNDIISEVSKYDAKYCVITGGEPMIAADIGRLCLGLKKSGMHITIETSGTKPPEAIECDLASISPKLSNSTPGSDAPNDWAERHEKTRFRPEVLTAWCRNYKFQLKFVVTGRDDIEEIQEILKRIDFPIPNERILLMPEGKTAKVIKMRETEIIDICKERGYRFCRRVHTEIYGDSKGI